MVPLKDRITQEVIRQLINPIFDAIFHENSFGFRAGRECHQALRQVLKYNQKGYNKLIDIEGVSDNIDHDIIMAFTRAKIAYGNGLDVESFLGSGLFVCHTNDILIMCKTSSETEDALKFINEKSRKKYEDSLHIFNTVKCNLEDEVFEKRNRMLRENYFNCSVATALCRNLLKTGKRHGTARCLKEACR